MSDIETLKAWVHWKQKEQNLSEDDAAFSKAVADLISQVSTFRVERDRLREQLAQAKQHRDDWRSDVMRVTGDLEHARACFKSMQETADICSQEKAEALERLEKAEQERDAARADAARMREALEQVLEYCDADKSINPDCVVHLGKCIVHEHVVARAALSPTASGTPAALEGREDLCPLHEKTGCMCG